MPLKERYTQDIFERPHPPADGGLLRADHPGRAAKTQALGNQHSLRDRNEIDQRKTGLAF